MSIYRRICEILEQKEMDKTELAHRMGRTSSSLNKLFFDLKLGSISLKNLHLLATGLEVEVKELFNKINTKQEEDDYIMWQRRILAATSAMPNGAEVELKQILAGYWSTLSYPQRQSLGRKFYREVEDGHYPNIRFLRKKPDNHALYQIHFDEENEE